jgi:hypothetical protein
MVGVVSDENVEVVRNALEHFAATDEFLGVIAPDFVWDMGTYEGWPDKPEFHGTPCSIRAESRMAATRRCVSITASSTPWTVASSVASRPMRPLRQLDRQPD